jgi:hypothetical protein
LLSIVVLFILPGCIVPADWRGDQTTCPLHGAKLKSETRQVQYGTLGWRDDYHKAEEQLFPNANTTVTGGCNVGMFDPVFAIIRCCPQCREAEQVWLAQHPAGLNTRKPNVEPAQPPH